MPRYCAVLNARSRDCQSDHDLGEIYEEKHRYTTKCFDDNDKIRITLGYLGLTAVVGVWLIAYGLVQL